MVDVDDIAPEFTLPSHTGEALTLADAGGPVVLFFYPRDDTPGCTKEAIAFSGMEEDFAKLGVKIWGCSADGLTSHTKFANKHALSMPLLADEDNAVCEAYGVWTEKKMYGKTFHGIERSTFLIDAHGKIAAAWRKVKVDGHADAVLDAAKALA